MAEDNKTVKPLSRKEQRAQEETQAQSRIKKTLIGVGAVCVVLAAVMVVSDINTEKNRTVVDKNYDYIVDGEAVELPASFGTVSKLAEYKGIEIDKGTATEITDTWVDYYITSEREEDTVVTDITDRAAQSGDIANIDYTGMMDGEAFDGGTAEGYDLELGSGSFIDGFEDGVIGMNVGDTKTLDLKFPDDYSNTELAGKETQFTVTLNSLRTEEVPELTDEWVKSHTDGEYTDVASYKEYYKAKLEKQAEISNKYTNGVSAIQEITENSDVKATAEGVKYFYNSYYDSYQEVAVNSGMSLEYYLSYYYSMELDTFKKNMADYCETVAEQSAVLDAIYAAEGMTVTDEDLENLEAYMGMTVDEALETYSQEWIDLNEKQVKVVLFVYDQAVQKPEEETTAAETSVEETTAAETTAAETTAAETTAAETTVAETTVAETTVAETSAEAESAATETTAAETTVAETTAAETTATETTAAETTAAN